MLGSAQDWIWLAVLVTPGWFAVRGWRLGRDAQTPPPLSDWLPLALALGFTWTVTLLLLGAAGVVARVLHEPTASAVPLWLGLTAALWLAPFCLGWVVGRASRVRRRAFVTLRMKDGTAVEGVLQHISDSEVRLADASFEANRHAAIAVCRADVALVLWTGRDTRRDAQPSTAFVSEAAPPSVGAAFGPAGLRRELRVQRPGPMQSIYGGVRPAPETLNLARLGPPQSGSSAE